MPSNRMTFTLVGRDNLSRAFRQAGLSARRLQKDLIGVGAGAAIPTAAAGVAGATALAGAVASAGAAVVAFTAAVVPQAKAMGEVAKAQKEYRESLEESGKTSQKAAEAQLAYSKAAAKLPTATRQAAAGFLVLGDAYKDWSESLAGDTMPVLTKSFAVFQGLLPRLTPLVRGASGELDRLMTVIAGGVASGGFDTLMDQFAVFSTGTLRKATDGLVHFMRVVQGFDPSAGALGRFMDYARENGPLVAETFRNLGLAVGNLLEGASGLGVSMLSLVNALAKLVAAIPPEFLGTVMQLYLTFRLLSTAAAGLTALRAASHALYLTWMRMSVAAAGATGAMATLRAAWMALGRVTRGAIVVAAVAAVVVGLTKLANLGKSAPPDVDKLSSALARLGHTGKVAGEAARVFGSDLDGLFGKIRSLTDPATVDKIQQGLVKVFSLGMADSTPVKDAKKNLEAIDDALAALVKGGKAELAASALEHLKAAYAEGGGDVSDLTGKLDDYTSAVEDARFEQQLAAEAMGLFGAQAQQTSAKLDEQKASADALRQAIQALNEVNRAGLGGMIAFEAAIDAAATAAKENAGALDMSGGKLNLNSEKARNAATALQDLAAKTDEAAVAAREAEAPWETVTGIYARGRIELVKTAQAMGLTYKEANQLADSILKIPNDHETQIVMKNEDALRGLEAVMAKIRETPDSKSVTVKALTQSAKDLLGQLGYQVKTLPDGNVKVSAATGDASSRVGALRAAIEALRSKTVTITTYYKKVYQEFREKHVGGQAGATGGLYTRAGGFRYADGGLVRGPGTGTSDDIPAPWLSDGEFVVNARQTAKHLRLLLALNAGREGFAQGGLVGYASGGRVTASSRKQVAGDLTALIKALSKGPQDVYSAMKALVADLRKLGASGRNLAGRVDKNSARLVDLSKRSQALADRIKEAKEFAGSVTSNALSGAALSNLPGASAPTGARIASGLQGKLGKLKQFAALVKKLAARGLSKALLRQVIEMGPEEGLKYAAALADADAATFRSINQAQAAIDKEAKALGTNAADLLYDSGKQAGKGFLAGLKAQQKDIATLMLKIAKAMQAAIRKALGIRSPSTVMARLGRHATRGLAVGLVDAMPHLDRALGQVTNRVQATRPMLLAGRMQPQMAMAGAGGPVTNNYTYTANITRTVASDADIHGAFGRMETKHRVRRAR